MMDWHDGDLVRVVLAKKGWTQVRFAEAMGLKVSTAGNLLNRADWKGKDLARASRVLGVNLLARHLEGAGMVEGIVLSTGKSGGHFLLVCGGEELAREIVGEVLDI